MFIPILCWNNRVLLHTMKSTKNNAFHLSILKRRNGLSNCFIMVFRWYSSSGLDWRRTREGCRWWILSWAVIVWQTSFELACRYQHAVHVLYFVYYYRHLCDTTVKRPITERVQRKRAHWFLRDFVVFPPTLLRVQTTRYSSKTSSER